MSDAALPPYRYGIDPGPHPTRDPRGHSFGRAEPGDDDLAIDRGIALFDHGFFWEAHEAFEGPWRRCAIGTPERALLQAAIQAAAAWLKRAIAADAAADRLAGRARAHLRAAQEGPIERLGGLRAECIGAVLDALATGAPRPPSLGAADEDERQRERGAESD